MREEDRRCDGKCSLFVAGLSLGINLSKIGVKTVLINH